MIDWRIMTALLHRYRWHALIAAGLLITVVLTVAFFRINGEMVSPRRGAITEAVYALGTVKSDHVFKIKAAIPMAVKKVAVAEGDRVRQGQTLLVSDSGTAFKAPFDGTVTSLTVNPGELVVTGMQLLVLQDLTRLHVEYSLDQESALQVRPGQKVELSFESIRGQRSTGVVDRIYPNEGQFVVRVIVDDLPDEVLPDMTADTAIEVARKENVLLIPLAAIKNGGVRRKRDGRTQRIQVKLGVINGEWGELIEGDIVETDLLSVPERKPTEN
ncbi:biotin/lipoyl attachment domain-containing protein [Leptonema illini DSM 21528]|uniref:Biotin/lipoyl attachment domain-containing protein n=2 Tax=Leptonema illini TaxID=183 RepID=H2CE92_9LEPT|nr:biotin/lipoyl attachment domain-containing protein [Leptonema illini DSM 21528]